MTWLRHMPWHHRLWAIDNRTVSVNDTLRIRNEGSKVPHVYFYINCEKLRLEPANAFNGSQLVGQRLVIA